MWFIYVLTSPFFLVLHNNIIIYGNGVSYVACGDVYIPYLLQVAQ